MMTLYEGFIVMCNVLMIVIVPFCSVIAFITWITHET